MDRERRAVLRGVAALTGIAAGSGASSAGFRTDASERVRQQVDAELQPGVTLFDLDGDGEYAVTVERAPEEMRDDDHPRPIHVTSGGRSTVDYAVSIVEPPQGTTLGGLDRLSYDYYEESDSATTGTPATNTPDDGASGTDDGGADDENGGATGRRDAGLAPGETFLVVENADGRHGTYLTPADADRADEQWRTFDVLAQMGGDATGGDATGGDATEGDVGGSDVAGGGRWFEYTTVEDGYDGESFDDVFERFGADARLVRAGVGHGNAVTPAALDAYYGNLVVDGETRQFPSEVVNRVS